MLRGTTLARRASAAGVAALAGLACAAPPTWQWQWAGGPNTSDTIRMIATTRDGGYVAVGQRTLAAGASDVLITRMTQRGAVVWERLLNLGPAEIGCSVVETQDGGFAVAGENMPGVSAGGVFLVKLDRAGNGVWGLQYPSNLPMAPGVFGARVIETSMGDLAVVGRTGAIPVASTQPMMALARGNGVPVWQFFYVDGRYGTQSIGALMDVRETLPPAPPGLLVAAGYTAPGPGPVREPLVMSVQMVNGAPVSSGVYAPPPADSFATAIEEVPGQGFTITAETLLPPGVGPRSCLIVPLAPAPPYPNIGPWWVYVGLQPGVAALDVDAPGFPPTPNLVIAGTTLPPNPLGQAKMTLLVAMAVAPMPPNPLAYWVYGGPGTENGNSVVAVDRGYTLAGDTTSFPAGPAAVPHSYFVRTDRAGVSTCNEAPVAPIPQPFPGIFQPFVHQQVAWQVLPFQPVTRPVVAAPVNLCFHCDADLNYDGVVDFNDLLAFLNIYNAQLPDADVNDDGVIDFNDLLAYLNLYNVPCP